MNYKINDEFPQFTLPQIKVPEVVLPEWPDGESPYELMQKSAHNAERQRQILEEQIEPLKEIANSAKRQADSAEQQAESAKDIATSAKEQADSSAQTANAAKDIAGKADIKGWIAIIISAMALFFEFIANREEITSYVQSLIQQLK